MPPNSISNINNIIKEMEEHKNTISKYQEQLIHISNELDKFIKQFPKFIKIERCYDYSDPEDFYEFPIDFNIHKSAKDNDIELMNKIFYENKLKKLQLYIDKTYYDYGQIITLELYKNKVDREIPHVHTEMYSNLVDCFNIFYDIKTKMKVTKK